MISGSEVPAAYALQFDQAAERPPQRVPGRDLEEQVHAVRHARVGVEDQLIRPTPLPEMVGEDREVLGAPEVGHVEDWRDQVVGKRIGSYGPVPADDAKSAVPISRISPAYRRQANRSLCTRRRSSTRRFQSIQGMLPGTLPPDTGVSRG